MFGCQVARAGVGLTIDALSLYNRKRSLQDYNRYLFPQGLVSLETLETSGKEGGRGRNITPLSSQSILAGKNSDIKKEKDEWVMSLFFLAIMAEFVFVAESSQEMSAL